MLKINFKAMVWIHFSFLEAAVPKKFKAQINCWSRPKEKNGKNYKTCYLFQTTAIWDELWWLFHDFSIKTIFMSPVHCFLLQFLEKSQHDFRSFSKGQKKWSYRLPKKKVELSWHCRSAGSKYLCFTQLSLTKGECDVSHKNCCI